MSDFNVSQFFVTLGFYLLWIIIVLVIWNFLWLHPYPITLPNPDLNSPDVPISNLFQATHYLYHMLFRSFTPNFWFKYCGFDALAYIIFIKRMLVLTFWFFLLSFLFGIPYSIGYSGGDILNSFNLNDDLYKLYFQMIFLVLFSAMYFQNLYKLKTFLSDSYHEFKESHPNLYNLQEKTLRFKGVSKSYDLEVFKQKLQEMLPNNEKSSLIHCILIPNTSNLLDLESGKQALLLKKTNLTLTTKDIESLQSIENDLQILRERGFISSGNAIICVNSKEALVFFLKRFSMLRLGFWRNLYKKLKVKVLKCCQSNPNEQALLFKEENEGILAYQLPNPADISWRNLNRESPISGLKRFGWNLLAVLFMIFFTTPASLITVLGLTELINAINHSDAPEPGDFSNLMEKNLSPLCIILINQLLLYIINSLAFMKRHIRISKTQLTIFNACFVYMIFNSFIIPALSMTTVESIFSFLSNESNKMENLLETFYLNNTGSLFIILLIQSATFSFTLLLLKLPDLVENYFNRRVVVTLKKSRLSQEVWLKDEIDNFQYGYFYANMTIFLLIVLVFSTTVPAISISGLFYFFFRLIGDGFELISGHRKEMDSNGKFINRVVWCCCLSGLFFQILIIIYYSVSGLKYNIIVMVIVLLASVVMTCRIEKVEIVREGMDVIMVGEEEKKEWEKKYRHPMVEFVEKKEEKL